LARGSDVKYDVSAPYDLTSLLRFISQIESKPFSISTKT